MQMIKITETSDQIRLEYISMLETLIINSNIDSDDIKIFINDVVNIMRVLLMDTDANVLIAACNLLIKFIFKYKELLYHFNSIISRSLFLSITHKQSKVKIAGLEALEGLMFCSPHKKNVEIMEQLIGFRDPNLVPIKDFYEPSTKINYFALLIIDNNFTVRKKFYGVICNWLMNLEDRYDHESRLVPYLLSGLFDLNEEISQFVENQFNEIGKQYEKDNEKEIRDERQFSIDNNYLKHIDVNNIKYPFPILGRPNLGCRLIIKKYIRRFIKNMCKELASTIDINIKTRVVNLILFSIIYAEDNIFEFLDEIILSLEIELSKKDYLMSDLHNINLQNKEIVNSNKIISKENAVIYSIIKEALKFIGKFCDFESIMKLVLPTIEVNLKTFIFIILFCRGTLTQITIIYKMER